MKEVDCNEFTPSLNKFIAIFVADWCGYCIKLINELRGKEFKLPIILVKMTREECWDKFDVEIIPTAVLYENGRPIKKKFSYRGLSFRDVEELSN